MQEAESLHDPMARGFFRIPAESGYIMWQIGKTTLNAMEGTLIARSVILRFFGGTARGIILTGGQSKA
jgi:hypothetical protein